MKEVTNKYGNTEYLCEEDDRYFDTEDECRRHEVALGIFNKEFIKMNIGNDDLMAFIAGGYGADIRVFKAFDGWDDVVREVADHQYCFLDANAKDNVTIGSVYLLISDYGNTEVTSIEEIRQMMDSSIKSLEEDMAYALARKERADGYQKDDV